MIRPLGLTFYPSQLGVLKDDHRIKVVFGGERAGKSFIVSADFTSRVPWGYLYWLVGPDYYQPRKEFEYISQFLWDLGAIRSRNDVSTPKEGSWELKTKSGQIVKTRTAADVRKLASDPVDGVLLCEAGQMSYATFLKLRGRISETRGFMIASGTFESSYDWFANIHHQWWQDPAFAEGAVFKLPTWENIFIFPGGRQDPEILDLERAYKKIPGYFEEKCGATPAPPLGVIFRRFNFLRHISDDARYNPHLPVYLGVDPGDGGPSPYVVAACQFVPDSTPDPKDPIDFCNVIDVLYLPGAQFEHVSALIKKAPWYPSIVGGAIDVETPGDYKRWRTILGIPLQREKIRVIEGERRLHSFLSYDEHPEERVRDGLDLPPSYTQPKPPHLRFSPNVPDDALREFMQYRSPIDTLEQLQEKPSTSTRLRRGPEHLLKALWYLLIARYGPVKGPKQPLPFVRDEWSYVRDAYANRPVPAHYI